jgi:hypothetical protein
MRLITREEERAAAVVEKMKDILCKSGYRNTTYQTTDCHAHYFEYEIVDVNGDIRMFDLQVELEGEHEIRHKPVQLEDWYFVGENFSDLMELSKHSFDIAV